MSQRILLYPFNFNNGFINCHQCQTTGIFSPSNSLPNPCCYPKMSPKSKINLKLGLFTAKEEAKVK